MAQKKRQSLSFAPHCRELTEALIRNLDHAKPLSELLTDEGAKANVIPQDPVIDVDALATAASLADKPSSVDLLFGCTNNLIQLVECKYRVGGKKRERKSLTPPTKSELEKKVRGTKQLLSDEDLGAGFAPALVLLFSDRHIEQARAWVNDYNAGKKIPLYKEMTTADFLDTFFHS
ncbi:MAG: hypothetical protein SOW36_05230 [Porphyromonas sp.]|uniref:hypothetical protein n=1 Tax=Porphyromonas sp. TaxID=1924944 RepID=UPI002A748A70|nr:hypothetical protein [Porphyromonas sp.]MDY3112028.1 hypothetical protein [Porphyromonas sp.]